MNNCRRLWAQRPYGRQTSRIRKQNQKQATWTAPCMREIRPDKRTCVLCVSCRATIFALTRSTAAGSVSSSDCCGMGLGWIKSLTKWQANSRGNCMFSLEPYLTLHSDTCPYKGEGLVGVEGQAVPTMSTTTSSQTDGAYKQSHESWDCSTPHSWWSPLALLLSTA